MKSRCIADGFVLVKRHRRELVSQRRDFLKNQRNDWQEIESPKLLSDLYDTKNSKLHARPVVCTKAQSIQNQTNKKKGRKTISKSNVQLEKEENGKLWFAKSLSTPPRSLRTEKLFLSKSLSAFGGASLQSN